MNEERNLVVVCEMIFFILNWIVWWKDYLFVLWFLIIIILIILKKCKKNSISIIVLVFLVFKLNECKNS